MSDTAWILHYVKRADMYVARVYAGDIDPNQIFKRHPGAIGGEWRTASIELPPESCNFVRNRECTMILQREAVQRI